MDSYQDARHDLDYSNWQDVNEDRDEEEREARESND